MIRKFLRSAALFVAPFALQAAVPLVDLVDDQTVFVFSVSDTPAVLRGWDQSPFARTWEDDQVAKFFAPLRTLLEIDAWDEKTKTATGYTVRELLALAEGEVLFAIPAQGLANASKKSPPAVLLALQIGDNGPAIEKLLDAAADKKPSATEETEDFAGITLHTRHQTGSDETGDTFTWAISEGTWFLSPSKERVQAAIDALKKGGTENALGKSERFLANRERTSGAPVLAYLNFPTLYPAIKEAMAARKAEAGTPPNPFGLDPESVLSSIGLDVLGEGYATIRFDGGETRLDFGLTYTEERGLVKLFAFEPGPVSQPAWVPAKWLTVSSGRFSFRTGYAALEELVDAISPMIFGLIQGQLRGINRQLGVDLKRDLIGSLGSDYVTGVALPAETTPGKTPAWDEMDQFFAISLDNTEAFAKSIEALKRLGGPASAQLFTKRDYLGQTLYVFTPPASAGPGTQKFTYAIANRTFLLSVGSSAPVENALQGMAESKSSYWEKPEVKAALAVLPPEVSTVQFQDLGALVNGVFESLVRREVPVSSDDPSIHRFVDPAARPDADRLARYWGLSSGFLIKTPQGLFGTTRITHPQP